MSAPEQAGFYMWCASEDVQTAGYWSYDPPTGGGNPSTRFIAFVPDAERELSAAARAEGVREGMLRAAEISDEKAEHLRKCNFKPGGFGPLGGWVGVASDVADRIRAAR